MLKFGTLLIAVTLMAACDKPAEPAAKSFDDVPAAAESKAEEAPKAPVESAPAVNIPPPPGYTLKMVPGDASDFTWELLDGDKPAPIPDTVADSLANASSAALVQDGRVLVWQNGDILMSHVFATKKDTKLVTFFPGADISELYSTPASNRIVIISRNPEQPDYGVKLFALDVALDGSLARKRRSTLDPEPLILCASRCMPAEVVFDSGDIARYLVSGGPEDPGAEGAEPVYNAISMR